MGLCLSTYLKKGKQIILNIIILYLDYGPSASASTTTTATTTTAALNRQTMNNNQKLLGYLRPTQTTGFVNFYKNLLFFLFVSFV